LHNFLKYLKNIKYPVKKQKQKELWDIEGIIKNRSNQSFKFDIRPLKKIKDQVGKEGSFKSKADKIVFESINSWIIVDTEELHNFLKQKQQKIVFVDELLSKLDWNIILPK